MPEVKCGFESVAGGATGANLLVSFGPTLLVDIGFDKTYKKTPPVTVPKPGIVGVRALVDTGATESCIDDLLAVQLNLPVFDIRKIAGVGGQHEVKMYLAQIRITALNINIIGAFAGVHLSAGGQPHKALIGRTFLQNIVMTYNGSTGEVIIKHGK